MDSSTGSSGTVRGIAFRPVDSDRMTEIRECRVLAKRGIELENRKHGKREVTLLSAESWADTCRDLGTDLPWYIRRANILVDGVDLASAIGRTVLVGPVQIHVHGETKPCKLMDSEHQGLRNALVPACRGGVFGQVLNDGAVRVGDRVMITSG